MVINFEILFYFLLNQLIEINMADQCFLSINFYSILIIIQKVPEVNDVNK